MTGGIHVLCVDDDADFRELTATVLERRNDDIDVRTAQSGRDGLAVFDEGTADAEPDRDVDCVVSHYDMPDMDGLELLAAVRERDPTMPFILFTGKGSETIASEAISAGVTDYLQKGTSDQYTVLANRIENAVEKRRADRARRESERELEQYRVLVETASDAMYVLDDAGRVTIANDAFCDLLDVDHDRVVGGHISTFISRASFERGVKTVHQLRSSGRESDCFECTLETSTDEQFIYEANVSVITDDTGEFAGSTAVIRDVTSRKQRERELAQYERIIELAPTALFILDADGSIGWCNDEFADAFAEDKAALLGMPFSELVDRGYYDEQVMTKYAEEVRTLLSSTSDRDRAKYQIQFYSADDTVLVHDVHTKLLPLEDGEFAGTIHAIRDITRRRHYRRELERQNERLEEFATVVSHDLRNPLNVAQGHLERLEPHLHELLPDSVDDGRAADGDADDLEDGYGPSVGAIRRALDRMDELIDNLLSLARHGQSVDDPEPVELSSLVRDAWEVVDTADAPLECSVDAVVSADEGRARALFENLFRNAIEHGGPDVTVTVGRLEDEAAGRPSKIGFYVADDGPGLETDADEIFEFGRTTTADGTGFGLAIVEGIAEAHGWTVTAESDETGTRFEVRGVTVPEDGARSTKST